MPRLSENAEEKLTYERLGDAIRAHRTALSMSQEALADAASINRTHMGEVERGKRNISFLALVRIAKAIRVSPSALLASIGL